MNCLYAIFSDESENVPLSSLHSEPETLRKIVDSHPAGSVLRVLPVCPQHLTHSAEACDWAGSLPFAADPDTLHRVHDGLSAFAASSN